MLFTPHFSATRKKTASSWDVNDGDALALGGAFSLQKKARWHSNATCTAHLALVFALSSAGAAFAGPPAPSLGENG
jgi:hypothetical protein